MAGDSAIAFRCPGSSDMNQFDHLGEQKPSSNQLDGRTAHHEPRGLTRQVHVGEAQGDQSLALISDTSALELQ